MLELIGRISQIIAFCSIMWNGCFLDSEIFEPFLIKIVISVVWIVIVQLLIDPVRIELED